MAGVGGRGDPVTPPDEGALVVDPAGRRWRVVRVEPHYAGESPRRRLVSFAVLVDPAGVDGRARRWVGWWRWHDWRCV